MGGFMPSSRLELWQGLVYAAHSPKDIALGLSSLKNLIAGNLPAKLNIFLAKKYLKIIAIPPPITDGWSPCGGDYETAESRKF